MQWIAAHRDVITALTSVGTLLVWVIYLQLFANSYRRQLRATLLITRGAGNGLDARCFLSNMSSGPLYVTSVLVKLQQQSRTRFTPVTDIRNAEGEIADEAGHWTRQGPLNSGETRDLGSFRSLIRQAMSPATPPGDEPGPALRSITIKVIGVYGSEDLPVGAERVFVLNRPGSGLQIAGAELNTRQIRGRRNRRELLKDLEEDR